MIPALYAAATGLMAVEDRQAVIANNIANAATPGFKRQEPLQKGFYQIFLGELRDPARFDIERAPGGGVKVIETFTDYGAGVFATTGDPLHVALQGPGFIAVDTPEGERFTRNGEFSVDGEGYLTTRDGHRVQDTAGGAINVSGGPVSIDPEGGVHVGDQLAGRIRIVEFQDPHMLTRAGNTLLAASPEALDRSAPASETQVIGGALEQSNVQVPREMVGLMLALRAYEANQRVIHSVDETLSRVIDQVGSPV